MLISWYLDDDRTPRRGSPPKKLSKKTKTFVIIALVVIAQVFVIFD